MICHSSVNNSMMNSLKVTRLSMNVMMTLGQVGFMFGNNLLIMNIFFSKEELNINPFPRAYKRDEFLQYSMSISEELTCAQGPAHHNDVNSNHNEDFSARREDSTHDRVSNAINHLENGNFNSNRLIGRNDKVVAQCVNGDWVMPSHECICHEEIQRRERKVERFDMQCDYSDRVIDSANTLNYSRYAIRSNRHHVHNNEHRKFP